ncbi:unnamed protein product [Sphagnum tenellum]
MSINGPALDSLLLNSIAPNGGELTLNQAMDQLISHLNEEEVDYIIDTVTLSLIESGEVFNQDEREVQRCIAGLVRHDHRLIGSLLDYYITAGMGSGWIKDTLRLLISESVSI